MTDFCSNVSCEAKIRRENGAGYELAFVPYEAKACFSAKTQEEAESLMSMDIAQDACKAVKEVEGAKATLQRAKSFGPVYKK